MSTDTDTLGAVWGWLTSFPVELALGLQLWVYVGVSLLATVIVILPRARTALSLFQFTMPLAIMALAIVCQWLADRAREADLTPFVVGLLIAYATGVLTAAVWTIVNMIRTANNIRTRG